MNESSFWNCSRRNVLQSAMLAASLPAALWAQNTLSARTVISEDDDEVDDTDKRYQTKLETHLIGDYTTFAGLEPVVLEGVGIVRGLAGTGGDPEPSPYRTLLLEDLKKQGYRNPNGILQSPETALVIVRAYLQPMMKTSDRLDVEVLIPESANATSLVGGELLTVRLSDKAVVGGALMAGKVYAIARGPVLTAGLGVSSTTEPALLKKGRVLSGGTILKERELSLFLRNDFRSIRNAQRISDVIGRRFHHFDEHGIKKPLANAKTDQRLILKVHPRYEGNFARYLQVIRHMAFRETPVETRVRMQRLKHDLLVPLTANSSALQLEAIGSEAIPLLKQGLVAPTLESRFHSAVALAYLGESTGLPALAESARKERAFRVFAFAAMTVIEDADAHVSLRELMNESSDETRYGAFRALWTLDRKDPFIRGERLGLRENAENHDHEYHLHVLQTEGPPLVHVTLHTRPEIVVFGANQEFSAPMYVSAGKHIMLTAQPGATTVSLARFEIGKPDQHKEVSLRVTDVIRAADELGATYPEILQMLADASKQKNLPTAIAADKLPAAGRVYYRPTSDAKPGAKRGTKIGSENYSPNMFPEVDDPVDAARRKADADRDAKAENPNGPMASVPADSVSDSDSSNTGNSEQHTKKPSKAKNTWSWFGNKK